ncbi:Hypothetical membrane protein [Rhodococcus sp. AW25M09]|uniref:hypothetical protein n=1 Tax=Rhodococcus sp. AW25M09 TaxID=1268303 RepID=UPI0002ACC335|nr:hypothetical protein [Rhodococcus sp. AW25M09]CCQ14660.1 Hypothetical membrane protein [Rhodococcus sp. AW25M09]
MKLAAGSVIYTVLMFVFFMLLNDEPWWKSLLGAVGAGALFTLLMWFYMRRAPTTTVHR